MSELEDDIEKVKPSNEGDAGAAAGKKGLPIKAIVIGIGAIFLVELIVLVVLMFTHTSSEEHATTAPVPSGSESAANGDGHDSTEHSAGGTSDHTTETATEHTTETATEHTTETAEENTTSSSTAHQGVTELEQAQVESHGSSHETESSLVTGTTDSNTVQIPTYAKSTTAVVDKANGQSAVAEEAKQPTSTPMPELNAQEFPSITFQPDGNIQIDINDADKLLKLLSK